MKLDEMIALAIPILEDTGVVKIEEKKKYIVKTFRGQISSFGAAVTMGSLTSAVAFYSAKGSSDTDRHKLMDAIYLLITGEKIEDIKDKEGVLLAYVVRNQNRDPALKQKIIDAAVALKLAMNAYELRKEDDE